MADKRDSVRPARSLEVLMEKGALLQFDQQMRRFAEAFRFRAVIKPSSPEPYDLFFQLYGDDINVFAGNSSDTGAPDLKFTIGLFSNRSQPTPSDQRLAPVVDGLKRHIGQVPTLRIAEEK